MTHGRDPAPASVVVVGGGAWGTALAVHLGQRYPRVSLWVYEASLEVKWSACGRIVSTFRTS